MSLLFTLIKTLTFAKLLALLRAQWAFVLGRFVGVGSQSFMPPYVTVEPTNRCNLQCPECASGSGQLKRQRGDMSLDMFKSIVDQIYSHTIVLNLYMQGEPFLNVDLPLMIAYAKAKNLFVSLSTNGHFLPELSKDALPHHLIVSADGATQASYSAYRVGGQLDKVLAFVTAIAQWKSERKTNLPFVDLQFLINRYNEEEIDGAKELFRGKYDRFVRKKMQIINEKNRAKFQATDKRDRRNEQRMTSARSCYKMLSSVVITQDGSLVPCCMDKDAHYAFGNVKDEKIFSLLNNKKALEFRNALLTNKMHVPICQNCPFA